MSLAEIAAIPYRAVSLVGTGFGFGLETMLQLVPSQCSIAGLVVLTCDWRTTVYGPHSPDIGRGDRRDRIGVHRAGGWRTSAPGRAVEVQERPRFVPTAQTSLAGIGRDGQEGWCTAPTRDAVWRRCSRPCRPSVRSGRSRRRRCPDGPDVVRRDGRHRPETISLDRRAGDHTPGRAVPVLDQLLSEVRVIRPSLEPDSPDVVAGRGGHAEELAARGIYPSAGQGRGRDDAPARPIEVLGKRGVPAVRLTPH